MKLNPDKSDPQRQDALLRYAAQVQLRRQSLCMDYPAHIHLETLSLCNASCGFCPYRSIDRRGNRMPEDLIAKIIKDLMDIPPTFPFQLSLFKVNEPFLDHRLFDILAWIEKSLPNASITLTSNGAAITDRQMEKLKTVRRLGYLWISVNEVRKEPYEQLMGLSFERTLERLDRLHLKMATGEFSFPIILSRVGNDTEADARFRTWVSENFPLFKSSIFQRGGWLGQVDVNDELAPDVGCIRWFDLSIASTGEVAHCCMDGKIEWPIGNAREQHLLEIYNAPRYRRYREQTDSRLQISPCNRCSFL